MAGYIGTTPVPQATQHRESFTATGGQTSFATAGYTPQFIDVYLNGVKLAPADYTATNGSDVVLASGATASDILEIVAYTPFEVANQTFTGDTSVTNLAVTGTFTSRGIDDNADAVAITIDSSENVGIGTTSPSTRLTVGAGAGTEEIRVDAGAGWADLTLNSNATNGGHIYFNDGSNAGEIFYYHPSDYMAFNTAATERMRIDSSGRVGIGTSSPATKLDVNGDGLAIRIDGTANTSRGIMLRNTGTAEGQIQTDGNMHFIQEDAGKYMRFSTANTERMRITSGGSVLIGTTSGTGDSANTAAVIGGFFTTRYGVSSIGSVGTWTTVHTFPNNAGNFMVSMRASGTGNTSHNSVGVAVIQASGATAFDYIRNGGNVQIRMSGLNLQVLQNVFAGANINWGVTNLGP